MAELIGRIRGSLLWLPLCGMAKDKIKEQNALALWELWRLLPDMAKQGLITQEQADDLEPQLNGLFHKAMDIPDQGE